MGQTELIVGGSNQSVKGQTAVSSAPQASATQGSSGKLDLEFTGNFIYDAAVVGWELYKKDNKLTKSYKEFYEDPNGLLSAISGFLFAQVPNDADIYVRDFEKWYKKHYNKIPGKSHLNKIPDLYKNISVQIKNKKVVYLGVKNPKKKFNIGNMELSSSYSYWFVSRAEQPYFLYTFKMKEKNNNLKAFQYIWPFINYAFITLKRFRFGMKEPVKIFIYHPNKKICVFINKQLRILNNEQYNQEEIIRKALLKTFQYYTKQAAFDSFLVLQRGRIDNQKISRIRSFSLKKHLAQYFASFAGGFPDLRCLVSYSKNDQQTDYLVFALNYTSVEKICSAYLSAIANQDKNFKITRFLASILADYQAYLEALYQKTARNVSPWQPFSYLEKDLSWDRISSRDIRNLEEVIDHIDKTDTVAAIIFSMAKGRKKDAFISLMTKLAFQEKNINAMESLKKISKYEKAWLPVATYLASAFSLGGDKNE